MVHIGGGGKRTEASISIIDIFERILLQTGRWPIQGFKGFSGALSRCRRATSGKFLEAVCLPRRRWVSTSGDLPVTTHAVQGFDIEQGHASLNVNDTGV